MKVYIVYTEDGGEIEGVFDESGKLLSRWCANDAAWRDEYFNDFMAQIGIEVERSQDEKLIKKLKRGFR